MTGPLIAVLDYGIGNLHSAKQSLCHVGADARLTADPGLIGDAAAVVLPGVGAFGACMTALHKSGLADIAVAAAADSRPFIGICVGMQLLFEGSEEAPRVPGLGVLPGVVKWLPEAEIRPQMQWNQLKLVPGASSTDPLLTGLEGAWMYFVHSLVAPLTSSVTSVCDYGGPQPATLREGSVWATQFHPEKSAAHGLKLLGNLTKLAMAPRIAS